MTALVNRRNTLMLIPVLAVSAVASARTLDAVTDEGTLTMPVLELRDGGEPTHTNFGPYDVEVTGVEQEGFHFDLQVAEEDTWIASCAIGDGTRLLCSFYSPDSEELAFLAVDQRSAGGTSGTLQGPGLIAAVQNDRAGWTLVDGADEVAGVRLRGRDRVWFDRDGDLATQPLLAAAAGALLVFDEVRR